METKHNPIEFCELKFNDDDWKVEGYASVFNSVDKVGDTILPGAFDDTIASGRAVKMFYEHMSFFKPGKWAKFETDKHGLKVSGYLTRDHSLAKDIRAELRHGTIEGLSIGFTIPEGGSEKREDGGRDIKSVDLYEVSFVGNPAEPKAVITAWKSELAAMKSLSDCEAFLRESGYFSRSMATAFVSHLKGLLSDSERPEEELERIQKAENARLERLVQKYRLNINSLTRSFGND